MLIYRVIYPVRSNNIASPSNPKRSIRPDLRRSRASGRPLALCTFYVTELSSSATLIGVQTETMHSQQTVVTFNETVYCIITKT